MGCKEKTGTRRKAQNPTTLNCTRVPDLKKANTSQTPCRPPVGSRINRLLPINRVESRYVQLHHAQPILRSNDDVSQHKQDKPTHTFSPHDHQQTKNHPRNANANTTSALQLFACLGCDQNGLSLKELKTEPALQCRACTTRFGIA